MLIAFPETAEGYDQDMSSSYLYIFLTKMKKIESNKQWKEYSKSIIISKISIAFLISGSQLRCGFR